MPNAVVQKFINELKLAGKVFLIDGARLVCEGVIVLTVEPDFEAEYPTLYRLEIPKERSVEVECPYGALFISCVCGDPMAVLVIRKQLGRFLYYGEPFALNIGDLPIKATVGKETLVIQAKPRRRPAQ
jgi:hypothetical protein